MAKDLLHELMSVLDKLRGESGCPWDQQQTFETLRKHVLEEAQEVVAAIDEPSQDSLKEELGDLLLQVLFLTKLAQEKGLFTLSEVVETLRNKIIKRKPHVFEKPEKVTLEQARENWQRVKAYDKQQTQENLSNHLQGVSPLVGAYRIIHEATLAGFQWPDRQGIYDKIQEELQEIEASVLSETKQELELEMGDLMLACVNLSHKLSLDPQVALERANRKFCKRYDRMQLQLQNQPKPDSLQKWVEAWKMAKQNTCESSPSPKMPNEESER